MRADVADTVCFAGKCRVSAPLCLLLAFFFNWCGKPFLGIFGVHKTNIADFALFDHLTDMLYRRITRICIGDGE